MKGIELSYTMCCLFVSILYSQGLNFFFKILMSLTAPEREWLNLYLQ